MNNLKVVKLRRLKAALLHENLILPMVNRLFFVCMLLTAFSKAAYTQFIVENEGKRTVVSLPNGKRGYLDKDSLVHFMNEAGDSVKIEIVAFKANRKLAAETRWNEKTIALQLVQTRIALVNLKDELQMMNGQRLFYDPDTLEEKEKHLNTILMVEDSLSKVHWQTVNWANHLDSLLLFPKDESQQAISAGKDNPKPPGANTISTSSNPKPKLYAILENEDDILVNPPAPPCRLIFNGKDDTTGENRKDVEPEILFSHTSENLKKSFTVLDMFNGIANLTGISGGLRFLNLEVLVATNQAPQILGRLGKGSLLEFNMLDGQVIRLMSNRADQGSWNAASGAYTYRCQFPIGAREEKLLRSGELDSMTLRWSKAMEIFPIHELDFFKRQFTCLDSSSNETH